MHCPQEASDGPRVVACDHLLPSLSQDAWSMACDMHMPICGPASISCAILVVLNVPAPDLGALVFLLILCSGPWLVFGIWGEQVWQQCVSPVTCGGTHHQTACIQPEGAAQHSHWPMVPTYQGVILSLVVTTSVVG